MSNDKVDVPIKVTLDSSDIKKLVKDEVNSKRKNDETLTRDEFLLDLMKHYYEEDERRNELIDSKNSQMIVLTGAMLTLQVTLFANLFVDSILKSNLIFCYKIGLAVLMILSFIFYIVSMYLFISAYAFKNDYQMVPNPTYCLNWMFSDEIFKTLSVEERSKHLDKYYGELFAESIKELLNENTFVIQMHKNKYMYINNIIW